VTTYRLGRPSELRRQLEASLPLATYCSATVHVTPRDRTERQCPAYGAEHYEVNAYYTTTDPGSLDRLEKALRGLPGVYLTTQVRREGDRVAAPNTFSNPDWPPKLGTGRRDRNDLRPQVLALIRD